MLVEANVGFLGDGRRQVRDPSSREWMTKWKSDQQLREWMANWKPNQPMEKALSGRHDGVRGPGIEVREGNRVAPMLPRDE
jgi:hypothetical protein